jgi:hypothetical protein
MELKEFIRLQLKDLDRGIQRVTDGLTQKDIEWQPACGCNSIGLILFHVFRAEDSMIHEQYKAKKLVWETGRWYTKLGVDINEAGAHYTVEQVNNFPVPKLEKIMEFGAAVRPETLAFLDSLKPADLDKIIKVPWAEMPLAMFFGVVIGHATQHIGEMSYLRGMKRGMDK